MATVTSSTPTITVMQPVRDEPQSVRRLSRRPRQLDGLSVALIDEGGPNADVLLAQLEKELIARTGVRTIVRGKLHGQQLELVDREGTVTKTVDTPGSILGELPGMCDAAIVGVGY